MTAQPDVRDSLLAAFRTSHGAIRETLDEIPEDWLWWTPGAPINTSGFLLWHLVRDEDEVVQVEFAGASSCWARDNWSTCFQIPREGQGTGFDPDAANAVRFKLADLRDYAEKVWSATESAIRSARPGSFSRQIHGVRMLDHLHGGSVGHNWVHLGEVRMLMGLRGWKFRE